MRTEIPEGYELVVGHSTENAKTALATAEERGLGPETVLRSPSGYLVPLESVPEATLPPANVEEAAERIAAEREAAEADAEDVDAEEVELPTKSNSNEEIDAWRDENLPGFEYPADATNKEKKVAALSAEVERHTALQGEENAAAEAEGRTPTLLTYAPKGE